MRRLLLQMALRCSFVVDVKSWWRFVPWIPRLERSNQVSLRFRWWSGKRHTTFCQLTYLGNLDGQLFWQIRFRWCMRNRMCRWLKWWYGVILHGFVWNHIMVLNWFWAMLKLMTTVFLGILVMLVPWNVETGMNWKFTGQKGMFHFIQIVSTVLKLREFINIVGKRTRVWLLKSLPISCFSVVLVKEFRWRSRDPPT